MFRNRTVALAIAVSTLGTPVAWGETAKEGATQEALACAPGRGREVAASVQARYDAVRDFSAAFEQSTEAVMLTLEALEAGDEGTSGRVTFAKPGRMRWAYSKPEESFVISNGEVLWIYDVAGRQATRLPVTEGFLAGAALQFLLGEGELLKAFEVSATACRGDRVELDLTPREPAGYERLGLIVDPASGLVAETSIVDLFGNRTRIRFDGVALDQDPPASTFEFTPPEGVEVIELAPNP